MSWILWHVFIISLDPEKDAKYQQSSAQIDAAKSKQTLEANKKSQQRLTRAQETAIGRGQRSTIGDKSVGDLGVDFVGFTVERLDTCVGVSSSLYLLPLDTVLRGAVGPRVVVFGEILGPADASISVSKKCWMSICLCKNSTIETDPAKAIAL